ncbi:MAG: glycosyltransferase [Opitutales bacterium]
MKILVFHATGAYQYGAVDRFLTEIETGFRELGHEILTVDVKSPDFVTQTQEKFAQGPAFVFTFNGAGHILQIEGKSLFDVIGTPFFNFLLDHPAHQYEKLDGSIENEIIACVERSHLGFLDATFSGKKSVFFIPHGGTQAKEKNEGAPPIDLIFSGSGKDPEGIRKGIQALPSALRRAVEGAVEILRASPSSPVHDAVEEACREEHLVPPSLYRQVPLTMLVEAYLRNLWRIEVLKSLDAAGIPVQIFGDGWEFTSFEHHLVKPAVDYEDSLRLLTQAKVALNVSPQFFSGSHERVLDAALNGVSCLTTRSSYLAEVFPPDQEMAYYDVSETDSVVEQARALLEDDSRRRDMAQAAKLTAGRKHTWRVRAEEVVDAHHTYFQMRDTLAKLETASKG